MPSISYKIFVTSICIFFLWQLQNYTLALEFDRKLIFSGEIWRIWTAHFVHSNNNHFALNAIAGVITYSFFYKSINIKVLLIQWGVLSMLISLALLMVYPNIQWYNGLSGLLHAFVAYSATEKALQKKPLFLTILVILCGKVLYEMVRTQLGYRNMLGEIAIIFEAHVCGVLVGILIALIARLFSSKPVLNRLSQEPRIE
ncbi:MAG: rhombosortase [Porticoccaceae bacterium]|nr:rhombosortase [Pseudomonadales bacterium]MCP5173415.1 rhombosortase [Pseudomonadales bacterium]MCP5303228.1 rhombosortase [Pseudomonadales bacterium]